MLLARAEAVKGGGAGGELGLGDERNAHGEREGADRENDSELKSKKVRERGEDMGGDRTEHSLVPWLTSS